MDPITKAHIYGMSILTVLSLIIAAAYYIDKYRKKKKKTRSLTSQAAGWKSIKDERPTWYKSIDILTPDGVIHEGWARVSDGDHDYYVSIKDDELHLVIPKITKWKYI